MFVFEIMETFPFLMTILYYIFCFSAIKKCCLKKFSILYDFIPVFLCTMSCSCIALAFSRIILYNNFIL